MVGGEEGLEHRTRKLVYNYISYHPGASFGVIRDFLEINDSTLKYHLVYLERTKKITSKREGRHRCYFCTDKDELPIPSTQKVELLNKTQKYILNLIKSKPGINKKVLSAKTKLQRKTLEYNLNKLIEQKLIWKVKNSEEIGYEYITKEKLRGEIYHELLMKLLSDEISEEKFLKIKKTLETIDIDEIEI